MSGSARGRRLKTPKNASIRPTSDRVREAVFNMLESRGLVRHAAVVDLFAGTGALGIEALSRGAGSAVFVDNDRAAIELVRSNLEITGLGDGATVVCEDVVKFLNRGGALAATVVFADPPYAFDRWDDVFGAVADSLVVAETDRDLTLPDAWMVESSKRHGSTVVTLARRKGGM